MGACCISRRAGADRAVLVSSVAANYRDHRIIHRTRQATGCVGQAPTARCSVLICDGGGGGGARTHTGFHPDRFRDGVRQANTRIAPPCVLTRRSSRAFRPSGLIRRDVPGRRRVWSERRDSNPRHLGGSQRPLAARRRSRAVCCACSLAGGFVARRLSRYTTAPAQRRPVEHSGSSQHS